MPDKPLYKDRFFLEDELFDHPEFFSAIIRNEESFGNHLSKFREEPWCQVDIGGTGQGGMTWGFCVKDQIELREALYRFLAYSDAFKRLADKLSEFLELK